MIESMFKQILKSQEIQTTDFDHKLVALSEDMNGMIQLLNSRTEHLTTNIADISVIQLRSGKQLNPVLQRELPTAKIVNLEENDDAVFANQTPVSTVTAGCRSTPANADTTEPDSVDRHELGVDRHQPSPNMQILQNPICAAENVTKPKVSFPKSPRKSKQELDDARCKAMMDKLIVEMPLIDVVKSSSIVRHYVKRMVTKDLNNEHGVMMFSAQTALESFITAVVDAASPRQTVKSSTAPLLLNPPPKRLRYSSPPPTPPDFICKTFKFSKTVSRLSKPRVSRRVLVSSFDDCEGKRSIPPIPKCHPTDVPHFHGQSQALTAPIPPWMMRCSSKKHLLPPSDPPDA
ncbi:hypothetical protein ISN45_At01g037190 [Arabidopsis thaliana x Arabidopsis arenosa]|uniref:Uncharacterized protein n=1 Tax=Arabidopsis thaliana x Arabidopsis arenosa TaxID=1240361 RepID=A0A8T2GN53_9BRAS|nr:hypothetical protein ISN45_At01g037190 [Arabidopsis thaliana x Arabidopsis arenosa]